eukprot:RCo009200
MSLLHTSPHPVPFVHVFDSVAAHDVRQAKLLLSHAVLQLVFVQLLRCYYTDHSALVFLCRCSVLVALQLGSAALSLRSLRAQTGILVLLGVSVASVHLFSTPSPVFLVFVGKDESESLSTMLLSDLLTTALLVVVLHIRQSVYGPTAT